MDNYTNFNSTDFQYRNSNDNNNSMQYTNSQPRSFLDFIEQKNNRIIQKPEQVHEQPPRSSSSIDLSKYLSIIKDPTLINEILQPCQTVPQYPQSSRASNASTSYLRDSSASPVPVSSDRGINKDRDRYGSDSSRGFCSDMDISPTDSPFTEMNSPRKESFSGKNEEQYVNETSRLNRNESRDEERPAKKHCGYKQNERDRSASSREEKANSDLLVWDSMVVGDFPTAFRLLYQQIGIVNFEPYKKFAYLAVLRSKITYRTSPEFPSYIKRGLPNRRIEDRVEMNYSGIDYLLDVAFKYSSAAKFEQAIRQFREILVWISLSVAHSRDDDKKLREAVKTCSHYILAFQMDAERKSMDDAILNNQKRRCELAIYVASCCKLISLHRIITLRVALTLCFNLRNFKMATFFSKKLLLLKPAEEIAQVAEKMISMCEEIAEDKHRLNYEEGKPFTVCAKTFTPIYEENRNDSVRCPFCRADFLQSFKGKLCTVCNLAIIGRNCTGLNLQTKRKT